MSFEKWPNNLPEEGETINKDGEGKEFHPIVFPHAERALGLFRKKYEGEIEKSKILEDVLHEFFAQEMKNTQIFKSAKLGASFPWTVIKTKELAEKIYASFGGSPSSRINSEQTDIIPEKQEFVFGSFINPVNGNQFTFVEEAMHQTMKILSSNLEALKEGKSISEHEIYTLGSPTNELGTVSDGFLSKLKESPFDAMAELYAEFTESKITTSQESKRGNVLFYGISMGGSFAAATAEKLIQREKVSQESDSRKPALQVRMDAPAGLSESNIRKWQIPIGFAAEGLYQAVTDPAILKMIFAEKKFLEQVKLQLANKGIVAHMTNEDARKKKEAIYSIINALREGVTFGSGLKVTKVTGMYDPLTFSFEQYSAAKEKEIKSDKKTLGKNLAPRRDGNRREFMVNMTHTPPFLRSNELKRYYRVVSTIERIRQ